MGEMRDRGERGQREKGERGGREREGREGGGQRGERNGEDIGDRGREVERGGEWLRETKGGEGAGGAEGEREKENRTYNYIHILTDRQTDRQTDREVGGRNTYRPELQATPTSWEWSQRPAPREMLHKPMRSSAPTQRTLFSQIWPCPCP